MYSCGIKWKHNRKLNRSTSDPESFETFTNKQPGNSVKDGLNYLPHADPKIPEEEENEDARALQRPTVHSNHLDRATMALPLLSHSPNLPRSLSEAYLGSPHPGAVSRGVLPGVRQASHPLRQAADGVLGDGKTHNRGARVVAPPLRCGAVRCGAGGGRASLDCSGEIEIRRTSQQPRGYTWCRVEQTPTQVRQTASSPPGRVRKGAWIFQQPQKNKNVSYETATGNRQPAAQLCISCNILGGGCPGLAWP